MTKTDLLKFCNQDRRPFKTPFSIENYTYATNGQIGIRVPLIEEVEKADQETHPMSIHKMFNDINWNFERIEFSTELPRLEYLNEDCMCDNGMIDGHDCPSCECERTCEYCKGTGVLKVIKSQAINIGDVPFDSYYLGLIKELKNPMIPIKTEHQKGMPFIFDDGCGLLMPLREGTVGEIKLTR